MRHLKRLALGLWLLGYIVSGFAAVMLLLSMLAGVLMWMTGLSVLQILALLSFVLAVLILAYFLGDSSND